MADAAALGEIAETTVFLDYFKDLPDPRQAGKVIYPLNEVLLLSLLAVLAGAEILSCDRAGITVTLPKPMTSGAKSEGRYGKQDFCYVAREDVSV